MMMLVMKTTTKMMTTKMTTTMTMMAAIMATNLLCTRESCRSSCQRSTGSCCSPSACTRLGTAHHNSYRHHNLWYKESHSHSLRAMGIFRKGRGWRVNTIPQLLGVFFPFMKASLCHCLQNVYKVVMILSETFQDHPHLEH